MQRQRWFADSNRSVLVMAALLMVYSALKGLRFPNLWSYTHYLFNYDVGFVKRGLIGELIRYFDVPVMLSYVFFCVFSFAVVIAILTLLIHLAGRALRDGDIYRTFCVLVFATSVALVMLTHTVGYFDHLGLLVTLLVLTVRGWRLKAALASVLFPLALLAHEAALVLYFPVLFVMFYRDWDDHPTSAKVVFLTLFTLVCVALTYAVSHAVLPYETVSQLYSTTQQQHGITLRQDAYDVLHRVVGDNLLIMQDHWQTVNYRGGLMASALAALPTAFFISALTMAYMHQLNQCRISKVLAILASYAPLVLHIAAWDAPRFNSQVIMSSFLVFLIVASSNAPSILLSSRHQWLATAVFVGLMIFNLTLTLALFDGYQIRHFPFPAHQHYLQSVLDGDMPILQIPSR
ncbi:Uncharacterised protein [BD1-7 clade bacterium]|uniref:DUF2029 domain-containing protein n=1 Tax=BD1-7 clade bacterium TaxID=2029982 RepID=A0A5S9N6I0_9GAMM|nr:Uncharacterised protein [BD1-7 clade bacterium]CAA0083621.1 Uncharacterised protein [BD1-7 clade bacterium]